MILLINKEGSKCDKSRISEQLCHRISPSVGEDRDVSLDELSLPWLITKVCNLSKYEASQTPKLNQKVG